MDPNKEDIEGEMALVLFGAVYLATLELMFEHFLVLDILRGSGTMLH